MKLKRVYLVEFKLWRKTRKRRNELWRQGQIDLPGLPDYGPQGRPEIEARLISDLKDDLPADASGEGVKRSTAPKWGRALALAPFLFIPLLTVSPRAWLVLSIAALVVAGVSRIRINRVS